MSVRYTILTSALSPGIGNGLTYEGEREDLLIGTPVRVPLRNKLIEGVVLQIEAEREKQDYDLKQIQGVLDEQPLVPPHLVKLMQWMADEYWCSVRQAARVFLPSPKWSKLLPEETVGYRAVAGTSQDGVRGKKQRQVLEELAGKEWMSERELRDATGVSRVTMKELVLRGLINVEKRRAVVDADRPSSILHHPTLSPVQKEVTEAITNDPRPSLLFGITGSGKTEVYAQLIAQAIERKGQAILLVPEILLTEHSIDRFERLVDPSRIAVIHSRLTQARRQQLWRQIRAGDVDLVIGSRSALFSPLQRLKLVILDEEHEWTYKNEQTPRYHARETAEALCRFAEAKLVFGTATPSLEAWARAQSGLYHLTRLPERYGQQKLPIVRIVDLATVKFGKHYPFSPPLLDAIDVRLKKKEQSVLFLNRRGAYSALLCLECRRRVVSPESQLPFTVHHRPDGSTILIDHTTNLVVPPPTECPHCHSLRLHTVGAGTQRVEQILKQIFPEARLLRADADTLTEPEEMRALLKTMRDREADILLGTQSVVKGLDLPGVTLAAVLLADVGLSLPHFRAGERIFQLLTQLTGRSGRAVPGEVIVQTYRPDAPEVEAAAAHRTEEYLNRELKLRVYAKYPPATRMLRLIARGTGAQARAESAYRDALRLNEERGLDLAIGHAPTLFGGGREWHVLVRGYTPRAVLPGMDLSDIVVDIDPIECV